MSLTSVSALGEFGLIERLSGLLPPPHPSVLKGIGDDAAVMRLANGRVLLMATDMLAEGIHFDLTYTPLKHLGYKAVAVNVSDIFAMNGRPTVCTLSLAFSSRFTVEALEELYRGVATACEEFGLDLVGGDTSSSRTGLVLSLAVLGEAHQDEVVYRSGAREHDLVCVSGDLGAAFAGLNVLEREKAVYQENHDIQPDLGTYEYVVGRLLKPQPRADLYDLFAAQGIRPTAMIDISDGLASELGHICRASQQGAVLYQDKLPIDPRTAQTAKDFNQHATHFALYGGEDYEMLFTLRPADYDRIKDYPGIAAIGHITPPEAGIRMMMENGTLAELKPMGWNHFVEG
jgi:thiamine-monophosphate kinase